MEPKIKTIEPIEVLYVRKTGPYVKSAQEAWSAIAEYIKKKGISGEKIRSLGISHGDPQTDDANKLLYDACIFFEGDMQPEGEVKKQTIEGGLYAIFTHKGPYDGLQKIYGEIFQEWLPASGKKIKNTPMFEDYVVYRMTEKDPSKWITDIYVPIEE